MAKLNPTSKDKIKEKLKFLKKYPFVLLLRGKKNKIIGSFGILLYNDEQYIKKLYKKAFGKELNLKNPQTFNEKLQWLKLYYRDGIMAICTDKFAVREYLKENGYERFLNTLYGTYKSPYDIDFTNLPHSFVLKASHGCGWNIVCKDKSAYKWQPWIRVMNSWLEQNLYEYGREWVYKDINPLIICEKYLEVENGELFDYKFFCVNGKVEFIQATDNDPETARINLYDKDWNLMKEKYAFISSPKKIPRPYDLVKMVKIAEDLSSPFPFARIDLYDINGKIVFGEITFFPSSGFKKFQPEEFDLKLGQKLKLPEKNYNF